MKDRKIIYEGKAKILYEGPEPNSLIQYFKDDTTAYNKKKFEIYEGKGILNNRISELIFQKLHSISIPTHFIKRLSVREQLVKKVDIIPVEVVIRNRAAGSMVKRLGIESGKKLSRPIIEFYYKSDELDDPMITEEHIYVFNWALPHELEEIAGMSFRINDFMSGLFAGIGIELVDFKLEFGRIVEDGLMRIVLADEISPDSCRLWDMISGDNFDKDRFRQDQGGLIDAYKEVAKRLGLKIKSDGLVLVKGTKDS